MDIISYSKASNVEKRFDDLFVEIKSENLFNKAEAIRGYYFKQNGDTIGTPVSNADAYIAYVPIQGVGNYSWKNAKEVIGTYYNKYVLLLDENKSYVKQVTGTVDESDNSITYFSINGTDITDGGVFFAYTVHKNDIDTAMIVKSETYPSDYIPYYVYNKISADELSIISRTEKSKNLFNKDGDIKENKAISPNTGAETSNTGTGIQYIPFEGEGTYYCLYPQNYYGPNVIKLCLYDINLNYLRTVSGTKTVTADAPTPCYFTISSSDSVNVAFIGYCFKSSAADESMFVKSTTYPSVYIPYYPSYKQITSDVKVQLESIPLEYFNPLYGKKVVFDGDSICHALSTGGWAKFIGEKNSMDYHNVGVSGGTITAGLYADNVARHWVSRYIDTIHTNYPTLDYLILEGGTNDADLLDNDDIGTLDQANFTTFDDETFIGALESLFYKATSYYPTAKIGFIVAHRMGDWPNYGYEADESPSNRRRRKFFEIAIEVCKKWGIPYIDLWQGSPLCPQLLCYYDKTKTPEENREAGKAYIDGQHLSQVGYNIISPMIEAWMKTL